MKKILLITGLFFLSIMQLNGQDWNSRRDSIRYAVAYEYIVNDSVMVDQEIEVSDKIMKTRFFLYDKILECYIRKDNERDYDYSERLYYVDEKSIDTSIKTENHNSVIDSNKGTRLLTFSNIFDGFLFASVSFTNAEHPFGFWFEYCFIFDLDNTIKKVFRLDMHGL